MTDPMNALKSFQDALKAGLISPQPGEFQRDLLLFFDEPEGTSRITYALMKAEDPIALAMVVPVDPIDGSPCINIAYAVDQNHRSKGYGREILGKALKELTYSFQRSGMSHLYVEAIVSVSNEHSNALASALLSNNPKSCIDMESGEPALQYVRQLF